MVHFEHLLPFSSNPFQGVDMRVRPLPIRVTKSILRRLIERETRCPLCGSLYNKQAPEEEEQIDNAMPDSVPVKRHAWVLAVNPHPIQSTNRDLEYGKKGSIKDAGTLHMVAPLFDDRYLVQYSTDEITGGAMCPSGTLIVVTENEYKTGIIEYQDEPRVRRTQVCVALQRHEDEKYRSMAFPASHPA
jgi:hypothetical protein